MTGELFQFLTEQRQAPDGRHLIVRRRILGIVKYVFGLFALLFVLGIGVLAYMNATDNSFRFDFTMGAEHSESLPPVMVNPRFEGVDEQGRPFTLVSDYATQLDAHLVDLQQLHASITMNDQSLLDVKARRGALDMEEKSFRLAGGVELAHDTGYVFNTAVAIIKMDERIAYGNQKVVGQGPMGTLQAEAFIVASEQSRIRFHGGVAMTVYPVEELESE